MTKRVYTDDEMALRVWDREQVKSLMSLRSFYICNDWRRKELDDLWVAEPEHRETASLGGNYGYYTGMDSIAAFYVVSHVEEQYDGLSKAVKDHPGLELSKENLGFGCLSFHPAATPLVYVAGDGKTARGLWYSIGCEAKGKKGGVIDAMWVNQKIGVDFIKEDGEWKIWHVVESMDLYCEPGHMYNEQPVFPEPEEDFDIQSFGVPSLPMLTHQVCYNWEDNYPAPPREYFSYSPADSYAPEGHPNFKEALK